MPGSDHPWPELPSLSSSLLDRARQMQPDAWSQLVTVFSPIVYRWCRQSGLAEEDASDVVQEVFSSVARGIGRFEPVTWQAFWLTTVDGLAAAEVAERLKLNVASVYQAKSRVLRRFRQRMGQLP